MSHIEPTNTHLISVVIPTYNRENLILEAIKSVIAQTYINWELIIMDDASTDNTESVVRDFIEENANKEPASLASLASKIQYIRQPENVGIAKNRNRGIEIAKGEYIAMLDSDDVWLDPEKLEKQIALVLGQPRTVLVGTFAKVIDEENHTIGSLEFETEDLQIREKMLRRNQFVQSSLLYKKDAYIKAGGYDATYTVADDYDLWLKMGLQEQEQALFANIPEYMVGYREHTGSITKTKKLLAAREHLMIIKKYKHAREYSHYYSAIIKAYARILKALF